jgi:subtilisin family serine protease
MRRLSVLAVVVGVTLAAATSAHAAVVPGQYIVVLEEGTPPAAVAAQHARGRGAEVLAVYGRAIDGYVARLTRAEVAAVRADPRVAYVEADRTVSVSTTQTNAPWGLDRIDQRSRPLSTTFTYFATGAGVRAYVIDTGIRYSHSQFGGRAVSGFDAVDGGSADDCNGHGTHVAGTIGGSTCGVAKGVTLVGVRVLGCNGSGTISGVIAGVNWVTSNHRASQPAVANMSLVGGASSALDTAVRNSIADGVSYAVAAGNGNFLGIAQNACNYSPARVGEAMTISATDSSDRKASWANRGSCVDWFAPGVSITSAWHTSSTATRTISGTSMATPHTAGVAALYLQGSPAASPAAVRAALFG